MTPPVVPPFPSLGEPGTWDELTLLAATTFLEAEGEPDEGKTAVAWTPINRVRSWGLTLHHAILGPDRQAYDDGRPWEPYSCWNEDYRPRARARLAGATGPEVEACWRAAAGALWRLTSDPTGGACFYLNVEVTRRQRQDGRLPAWAADPQNPTQVDPSKVVARIGRHHFLKG